MNLSYNWLKQFLPSLKQSPEQLGEILSMQIAEVEEIIKLSQGLEKVIVAEIIKIKPHPQADKLQIVVVNTGKQNQEIVCGATNIKPGQKVPLACQGAKLSNGVEIKSAVIRGVKSNGMLCAEDELGLGSDHEGILILPSNLKAGQSLTKALKLDDTILDIENKSLTHRPDLFNHIGFAREIGAVLNIKPNLHPVKSFAESKRKSPILFNRVKELKLKSTSNKSPVQIKVQDKKFCPRYMAVVMDDIKITCSPDWLQNRLRNLGIKPINNVVDITNYILIEIGQPLHAFDADKIKQDKIIIRRAEAKEKLLALDGQEYELSNDDLVIADIQKPVALAGVIGGELSSITDSTKRIVIESANFDSANIRRTAWRFGLRTEAVVRFEKGLPMVFPEWGLVRAIELIKELANGSLVSKIYDIKSNEANRILKRKKEIVFDPERARIFIGAKIKDDIMKRILKSLDCKIKARDLPAQAGKKLLITPPAHRPDLSLFEDLIEEVVRIYGTEKITPQPILGRLEPVEQTKEFILEKELKNILTGCGFDEVYNYAFADEEKIKYFGKKQGIREIANPLNEEQQYLRQSLVPGLVVNAEKNSHNFPEFKIFEIGRVFCPQEKTKVAGLIFSQEQDEKVDQKDVYQKLCQKKCFILKNIVELIFERIGVDTETITYPKYSSLKGTISFKGKEIGFLGEKDVATAYFELDFDSLVKIGKKVRKYQPIFVYPPVKRDLAFLIDKNITWKEIYQVLNKLDELIVDIEPFDVFKDKEFGNKYNLGFHITYQSLDRTLKAKEIEEIEKRVIEKMEEKFIAQLRDF